MKKSSFFLVVLVWLGFFSACSPSSLDKPNKSLLVQRLESIFYQESFTQIPSQIFEVTEFGAKGDGKTLNTQAIQNAIDAAHEVGGGKVTFPPGTYVSGAIFVKSNVELNIPQGVSIIAIQDDKQFPDIWTRIAGIEMEWPAALINIYQQQNVRITGKGIIDGNGKYWWDKFWGDPPRQGGMYVDYTQRGIRWAVDYDCKRVRPVAVYESKDVLLQDFSVKRAGFWTISLTYSERVYVNGLIIRNNIGGYGPSSDGINSDSSKDILVENCDIDCNDDNLCIKAGRDADGLRVNRPAENIVYRNCITRSGHGLFTIGSETSGGVRNVEVYGLEAIGTNIGIRFKSAKVRGGLIENVWFHDIKMKQVNHPFHFELNWYPEYSYPQIPQEFAQKEIPDHWKVMTTRVKPPARGIPEFRNIRLSNITVEAAKEAIYANAFPEKPIHHLSWENVSIKAEKGGKIQYARDWEMDNVFISLKQPDQPIQLIHSEGIKLAPDVSKRIEPIDAEESDATEETFRPTPTQPIIPVHSQSKQPVFEGDTTTFSENPKVYLTLTPNAQINYFEPLGDGFYIAPISIAVLDQQIRLTAEREHNWTFELQTTVKPQTVSGADNWTYDEKNQTLSIEKSGSNFQLKID